MSVELVDEMDLNSLIEPSVTEEGDEIESLQIPEDIDFGDFSLEDYEEPPVTYNKTKKVVEVDDVIFDAIVDPEDRCVAVPTGVKTEDGVEETIRIKAKRVRKKKKRKNLVIGTMYEENFGDMLPFIKDKNVTDINWNGYQLWIDDVTKGRYKSDIVLDLAFVNAFTIRVANVVSRTFNKYTPKLEAETDELRITVIHESVSRTGRAISIRKTPAVKRINFMDSIRNGEYCPEAVANLMSNSIKAKFNVVICGLPGVGKTELVKFLTNYIFPYDRAITIEDTLEIRYSKINPGKDCLELKVEDSFTYTDAIKASLRLLPQWILLSEARSVEVKYLLESLSTGGKCITTLHTDDVRKVPERVVNMLGEATGNQSVIDTVHSFFDLGILIDKKQDQETGRITRWIAQVCMFIRENEENRCIMLYDRGELTGEQLTDEVLTKYQRAGIADPFKYTFVKAKTQ